MKAAILIDFGSTFTKVAVVNLDKKVILVSTRFPSTVKTNAGIGLKQCLAEAQKVLSEEDYRNSVKLASSSAAGGLRMAVVGISPTLSMTAGKNAAFGAGAKIVKTVSGKISSENLHELESLTVEILLFCGGYENGNKSILIHNADMLASCSIFCPIIYAGNSSIAVDVRRKLTLAGKECFIVPNIIPDVGILNIDPAERIIRDVFLKRIIHMKGLDIIKNSVDAVVMPTPAAVLSAGELLSKGTAYQKGMGPLMLIDIGGATTDVHSYTGQTAFEGAKIVGVEEPYVKRTVEGDLGMRESSETLLAAIGIQKAADELDISMKQMNDSITHRMSDTEYVADNDMERAIDNKLAAGAVNISVRRHAGVIRRIIDKGSPAIQIGKNLSDITTVIGTGGPIVHSKEAKRILSNALSGDAERDILLPKEMKFFLDQEYVLYAAGLLREVDEEAALAILRNSIVEL